MSTKIAVTSRPEMHDGWRQGRPVEDPEKTKRWGYVTAKPSEYLVHVRRGRVLASSGQGATCFKWPWDAVAIVPTSLQRLAFRADQITRERVGVEVVGLAVYRIADPLIAYRVLNFSYPERAQQKLEETLSLMFVGATRRLVANLSVDECLQKRKTALAEELLREVAPVVGGEGSPDDVTAKGWGVVIDTIEIQEVRVLSERVFQAMQAPFRSELDRAARQARADAEREIALRETECRRGVEESTIQAELALAARRAEAARAEAEARKAASLRQTAFHREVEEARLAAEAAVRERQRAIEDAEAAERARAFIAERERMVEQARAELEAHGQLVEARARRSELERMALDASLERRRLVAAVEQLEGQAAADTAMLKAKVEREQAEARARVAMAERLPELAGAVGQRFGEVKVTQIGDGAASPFASIAQAVASVVELAKSA